MQKGKHNRAVINAVSPEQTAKLQHLAEGKRSVNTRHNERRSANPELENIKSRTRDLWKQHAYFGAFKTAVEAQGWHIKPGSKKPEVLILTDKNDRFVGSLNRIIAVKKSELHASEQDKQIADLRQPYVPKPATSAPTTPAKTQQNPAKPPASRPTLSPKIDLFAMQKDAEEIAKLTTGTAKKGAVIGLQEIDVEKEWEKAMEISKKVAEQIAKHIELSIQRILGVDHERIRKLENPKNRESFYIKSDLIKRIQPEYLETQRKIKELSGGPISAFRNRHKIQEHHLAFQKTLDKYGINAKSTDSWDNIAYFVGDKAQKVALSRQSLWKANEDKVFRLNEYADCLHQALDNANRGDEVLAKMLVEGRYDEAVARIKRERELEKFAEEQRKKEELQQARKLVKAQMLRANAPVSQARVPSQPSFTMR